MRSRSCALKFSFDESDVAWRDSICISGAAARELYGELVRRHQRKATRIALYYLRESAEADEAVQDAFVKAYTHLRDFEYGRSFEVWFTRILVNSCLDRVKARGRRARWMIAVFMPMTRACASNSGPPLLPGLIAASV